MLLVSVVGLEVSHAKARAAKVSLAEKQTEDERGIRKAMRESPLKGTSSVYRFPSSPLRGLSAQSPLQLRDCRPFMPLAVGHWTIRRLVAPAYKPTRRVGSRGPGERGGGDDGGMWHQRAVRSPTRKG